MPARFYDKEVHSGLKHRRALSSFLDHLIRQYLPSTRRIKLSYIFCTDAHLHSLNVQYLKHDTLTDIITFDMHEKEEEIIGEIYISTERVAENVTTFSTTYDHELHRVIFHGALHLCGLSDKTPSGKAAMRKAEDAALTAWFGLAR